MDCPKCGAEMELIKSRSGNAIFLSTRHDYYEHYYCSNCDYHSEAEYLGSKYWWSPDFFPKEQENDD